MDNDAGQIIDDGRVPLDRGYVQVYTGDGKGKTTAAIGLAIRAVRCSATGSSAASTAAVVGCAANQRNLGP